MEEHKMRQKPKPITFYINSKEECQSLREEVKFVIEGGGKAIQTSFVRKNEEEFFEFMNDFSNPHQIKNPKRLSSIKEENIIASVCRRRKTIKTPMIITPQDFAKEMELEEVCEEIENRDSISNSDKDSDVESAQPNFNNRKTLKVPPDFPKSKRSSSVKPQLNQTCNQSILSSSPTMNSNNDCDKSNNPTKFYKKVSIYGSIPLRSRKFTLAKINTQLKDKDLRSNIQSPISAGSVNENIKHSQSLLPIGNIEMRNYSFLRSPAVSPICENRKSIIEMIQDIKSIGSITNCKKTENSMFYFDADQSNKIISLDLGLRKNIPTFQKKKINEDCNRMK